MKDVVFEEVETSVVPTIGIITALSKEYVAVEAMLDNPKDYYVPSQTAGEQYLLGEVPTITGGKHSVVLSRAVSMGNNLAAIWATLLLRYFPTVKAIIMVGIAGGIPNPKKPDEHVRLGDVVVSNEKGVVQYDFVKEEIDKILPRYLPRPPSARLLDAAKRLEAAEIKGDRRWVEYTARASYLRGATRPSGKTDILVDSQDTTKRIRHPRDPKRIPGQPRVFLGPIASANTLLKDPVKRDSLRDQRNVKAVEMEGSGIADATWVLDAEYLVVRGICDYCDSNKGDDWQNYAAVVAAAYTRGLLESIPR